MSNKQNRGCSLGLCLQCLRLNPPDQMVPVLVGCAVRCPILLPSDTHIAVLGPGRATSTQAAMREKLMG